MARKRKDQGLNVELFAALDMLERDKGIPVEMILGALEDALSSAYPKTPGVTAEHARVEALEAENTRLRAELERLRGSTP
jgi:hypothetical protein